MMSAAGVMVVDVVTVTNPGQWSGWIVFAGGLAVAVAAIAAVARGVWRVYRRFDAFFEDWFGQPGRPGRPRVPGIPERVEHLEQGMAQVSSQVTPNGGHTQTLGDQVVRIAQQLGTDPDHDSTDETGGS